jgi:NAD(P)-dependent dehydrogenase (short-subunit alcohol dehydrogenase family)
MIESAVMGALEDKVAIVTGGARGIGKGIAARFAREGAKVVVVSRTPASVEGTVEEIRAAGGVALGVPADVGDRAQVDRMVATAIEELGRVDILVNVAQSFGTAEAPASSPIHSGVESYPEDQWDHLFQTGVKASLYGMQAVFPGMKERGWGRIINFGSAAEQLGTPFVSAYAANKAAIRALSRTAAHEWGRYGITVNVINPVVASDAAMGHFEKRAGDDPEKLAQLIAAAEARNPMGRSGTPADAGGLATFICSNDASYLTAMTFLLDGGSTPS